MDLEDLVIGKKVTNKRTYKVVELNNSEFIGSNFNDIVRKSMRKLVSSARAKKKDINIFETFKNIKLTIIETETAKEAHFLVNIIKNVSSKKSLYYKFDYNVEVYKRQALL